LAFVAAAAILAAAPAHAEDCGKNGEGFSAWLASFKEVAVKDGLSRRAVDAALDGVSYDPTVKRHDGGAAMFGHNFASFAAAHVSPGMVARGKAELKRYAAPLAQIEQRFGGELTDFPFVVHGTTADPRFFDLTIDANDRAYGTTLWGPPQVANYLPTSLGHFNSARSWLSQWSIQDSNAGAHNLNSVSVPVLILTGTGDPTVLPSHTNMFVANIRHADFKRVDIPKATHYFEGQPELMDVAAAEIGSWLGEHGLL